MTMPSMHIKPGIRDRKLAIEGFGERVVFYLVVISEEDEEEKAADNHYLNSQYALFDGAIAQHLDPVLLTQNRNVTSFTK